MYFLVPGEMPFDGKTDSEIRNQITNGNINFKKEAFLRISTESKILIKLMLTFDHTKRISAENALQHKWFKSDNNIESYVININYSNNVSQLKNKLQQVTLDFITHYLDTYKETVKLQKQS